jgi:thiol:disulfide interchange protein DsbD
MKTDILKKFLIVLAAILPFVVSAQIVDPVKWKFSSELISETEADIIATATIESKWHVYAQIISSDPKAADSGPIPTKLSLSKSDKFTTTGGWKEGKYITHNDPNFEMELNYFENSAVFRQRIKFTGAEEFEVKGNLEYMACDDSRCIFPDPVNFKVKVVPTAKQGEVIAEEAPAENLSNKGILKPVKWTVKSVDLGNDMYEIIFTAVIDEKWHLYSQKITGDGPVATSFKFENSADYSTVGVTEEPQPEKKYDPNFMMDLTFFSKTVEFKQRIKTAAGKKPVVDCMVNFMCCDDEKCLPPTDVHFKVDLAKGTGAEYDPLTGNLIGGPSKFSYSIPSIDLDNPVYADCGTVVSAPTKGSSLWDLFILGFLGGLIALLTPCVFPMIPLTVSFFTKSSGQSRKKGVINAAIYGGFIFGIYLLLSLPFHIFTSIDENILNNISTNVPLNIAFFVIFIVFAISFFGYFEITLPSSLANKMDNASNVGGLVGSFFMALTLAIVSFSCTGPILGSLLAGSLSNDGGAIQLTAGMGGFGLALGIPFAVFAAFPGMLKSLPKSGGWLNSVKVVLGFVEVALALKFFSQADMVAHWNILKYELFLGLWIVITILTGLYIFGFIKFPHDSPIKKRGWFRLSFGALFIAFGVYLATGFTYNEKYDTFNSLSLLSGLAPPVGYSWTYKKDCPHNLDCEHDYLAALERAKREGKPLFLDFTGYACVNCRKMEEHVWIKPEVLSKLEKDFIVVSLYVDDRKELPAELQEVYTSMKTGKTKEIKTYGDRWSAFQIETFNSNSQPWYCIVSPEEKLLNKPVGYTPDVEEYVKWLDCGVKAFESQK